MKKCKDCGRVLELDQFYVHSQMADGHLNKCKDCVRIRVGGHRECHLDRIREYDRQRGRTQEHREATRRYAQTPEGRAISNRAKRAWIERNKLARAAHIILENALRDGRITKRACEVCGSKVAHGHHDDYAKPLDVRWLCSKHHAEHHVLIREQKRKK